MDVETQLAGLNKLLADLYGNEMDLVKLLCELGFEETQVKQLQDGQLNAVITDFLEVLHKRLTSDSGKDTYYHILRQRYGLDGEPPQPLSAIADMHGFSPEYLRHLFEEILGRCRTKTWQEDLRKRLKYIAVDQLGKAHGRPVRDRVTEKLERLSSLRNALEFTRLDYETKRREILKQVQADLDALDEEYKPVLESAGTNLAALENEIKTDVLLFGESVSGGMYRAVYSQGRTSWDNKGMTEYAALHPEVLQFRKQGQPVISLRIVDKE